MRCTPVFSVALPVRSSIRMQAVVVDHQLAVDVQPGAIVAAQAEIIVACLLDPEAAVVLDDEPLDPVGDSGEALAEVAHGHLQHVGVHGADRLSPFEPGQLGAPGLQKIDVAARKTPTVVPNSQIAVEYLKGTRRRHEDGSGYRSISWRQHRLAADTREHDTVLWTRKPRKHKLERVTIVTDRDTGRARGFGFVEMSANAEADRAIAELNGKELGGRVLNVNEARPKTERGSAGGDGPRRNNRW
jgi:cold-inducible RNA-binding protein